MTALNLHTPSNTDQILQKWTTIGEMKERVVGDENALFQVQLFQIVAIAGQRLKAIVGKLIAARDFKRDKGMAALANGNKRSIG